MPQPATLPRVIIVMGVSGSGKSTVGAALARRLHATFIDADDLHSPASKAKMAARIPLTDEDRWPWLDRLRREVVDAAPAGSCTVLACSALRRAYRQRLLDGTTDVRLVHLRGSIELIAARLALRTDHFMPPDLLASQFAALEEPGPGEAVIIDIDAPPDTLAERAVSLLVRREP